MERAAVNGDTIAYQSVGHGEPVVFIHGALIADAFVPMSREPALSRGYRLIVYHRRGYGASGRVSGVRSMDQQADDCAALLRHLDIDRAHIVGHSLGGAIAVQLALDVPEMVQSLALLEPALFGENTGNEYRESLALAEERFGNESPETVVDDFLRMRFGVDYRVGLERNLPGSFRSAVVDAATTFLTDLPGLRAWRFDEDAVKRLPQPILNAIGSESEALWPRFGEVYRMLFDWLPQAKGIVLNGAAHGLMMQNPREMAAALHEFWASCPIQPRAR